MVEMVTVESSNIAEIGYDAGTKELFVKFAETGKVYKFFGVEAARHDAFLKAGSKGDYLNTDIKTNYRYEQVEG